MSIEFKLPELGEGVAGGDILRLLVAPGDTLAKDQTVFELETDKATIEVPSSVAGRVKDVKVKAGDTVKVGQVILTVDDAASEPAPAAEDPEAQPEAASSPQTAAARGNTATPAEPAPSRADAKTAPAGAKTAPAGAKAAPGGAKAAPGGAKTAPGGAKTEPADVKTEPPDVTEPADDDSPTEDVATPSRGEEVAALNLAPVSAPPSVRRLARELGIEIGEVSGSAPDGRISVEDVKAHSKRVMSGAASLGREAEPLPDFSRWGAVERQPMRAVRRKTAEHLSAAWATIPHVTQHGLADVTNLEELRKTYTKQVEAAGGSLTVTSVAVKIAAAALRVFPQFNASIDFAAEQIVSKKYVHIGVAVDTDRGLLVPVIRDADRKNITQLSVELLQLSEKARTRKLTLDEMQGGCFSVSNLGGIGGSYFTPIINAPEVAILGISRARMEPVYDKDTGQFVPRLMLPLSLSYDHRVIDGADGARFLRWVVAAFEQPFLLALQA